MHIKQLVADFIEEVRASSTIELYNEAGLRHEMAVFLRGKLGRDLYGLQLGREVEAVAWHAVETRFVQDSIDLYLFHTTGGEQYGIQIQVEPEAVSPGAFYEVAANVNFLEQLTQNGFTEGHFLFASPNPAFWSESDQSGFRHYFPGQPQPCVCSLPTNGNLAAYAANKVRRRQEASLPNGDDPYLVKLKRAYPITWQDLQPAGQGSPSGWKCFLLQITPPPS